MPCYSPLKGYKSKTVNPSGKRSIVFDKRQGFKDLEVKLPCGQCIGCRLEKSRQWAVRCCHEASLYDKNCFLTLTYSDEHLPRYNNLDLNAPVAFVKRLRKKYGAKIRTFGCAEYGENFGRPHYHLILFNFDFPDKELHKTNSLGHKLWTSPSLDSLWGLGHALIGAFSFETAAYVARYVTKKVTGDRAAEHYSILDLETGEISARVPESSICVSRRPGIGKPWLDKFLTDVYPNDSVVLRGVEMAPPKYYERRYEIDFPSDHSRLKKERFLNVHSCCGNKYCSCVKPNDTPERLSVREFIQNTKRKLLKRNYEND